jgi:putative protease
MTKPELILPAGSFEKLKYAFAYGADAVYAGLPESSLRAQNNSFSPDTLKEAIHYTHNINKKIYITVNLYAHEENLSFIEQHLLFLKELGPDALIFSDPGVFNSVKSLKITIPLHLSTQANTTNSESVKFWRDLGIKRVILARELEYQEISEIREKVDNVELEIFVHGAMCMSYSGRCLLSNFLAGRDANRGECAQPCRWKYYLVEENRKTDVFEIEQGRRGAFILNSKDLRLVDKISELKKLYLDGFKVEGRTKNVFYIAIVAKAYRSAIDDVYINKLSRVRNRDISLIDLLDNHGYTHGFTFQTKSPKQNVFEKDYKKQKVLGFIEELDCEYIILRVKNPISIGDEVIGISPDSMVPFKILDMTLDNMRVERAFGAQKHRVRACIDTVLHGDGWEYGIVIKP